jgi:myo-inositol-1(or 4)-monophosphatase
MTSAVDLRNLAVKIAEESGKFLMDRPSSFDLAQKSGIHDFATQMDQASEKLIVELIRKNRPDDSILGEEGAAQSGSSGFTWIVDPIDGTVNYLYGVPGWCVSIAVKNEGRVIAGAVYSPSISKMWSAAYGSGAECNGESIRCNEPIKLTRALVGTGFAYDFKSREAQGNFFKNLIPKIRDIRRIGACAVDICLVASGVLDAYYEAGVYEWDFAAAGLIARESGAKTLIAPGVPSDAQFFVMVAGPSLYAELGGELIQDGRWISRI